MVAHTDTPTTHYLDDRRKLHPDIASMIKRLHLITGDPSWAIRRHAPGGDAAYYQIVKVDRSAPAGYRECARRHSVKGIAALRAALDGLLCGAEETPMSVTVLCRHWQGRHDRESTSTGRILINGRRACYPDGSPLPALLDGCHHRTDPSDVREILAACGMRVSRGSVDVETFPVSRKADLYDDAAPRWAIMDRIKSGPAD